MKHLILVIELVFFTGSIVILSAYFIDGLLQSNYDRQLTIAIIIVTYCLYKMTNIILGIIIIILS